VQVEQIIKNRSLENVEVILKSYLPSPFRVTISYLISAIQLVAFAAIFAGNHLVNLFGLPPSPFLAMLGENKMTYFIMVMFGGNFVNTQMMTTHAFEIFIGRDKVWSTLEKGRMPQQLDIVRALSEHKDGFEFIPVRE